MKLNFYNAPSSRNMDAEKLPSDLALLDYRPNFEMMDAIAQKYSGKKNLIIIGHGGSISTFFGIYHALKESTTKQVYFVQTVDPDRIVEIKKAAPVADSLVLAISKSGETVTQLEALMQFLEYDKIFITGAMGPLAHIAEKLSVEMLPHPPIGGRFSGLTEVSLLPAVLCGLDALKIFSGGQGYLQSYKHDNDAYRAADILAQLEEQGVVEVLMQIYDAHLFPFSNMMIQMCHESFGKEGRGQTYVATESPESQHHTSQRFFGGRKNIAGWFLSSINPREDLLTTVPDALRDVTVRDGKLGMLDGIKLSQSLKFELEGTLQDARIHSLPVVEQQIDSRSAESIGELIAFWQLFAIYSAVLRNVDPFNQPQVENSKKLSFDKRLTATGHF